MLYKEGLSKRRCSAACQVVAFTLGALLLSPASAHRYSESSPGESEETYFWIKRERQKSFLKNFTIEPTSKKEPFSLSLLLLNWLDSDSGVQLHATTRDDKLSLLATYVIMLRESLSRGGYPKAVWHERLLAFEENFLRQIASEPATLPKIRACILAKRPNSAHIFEKLIRSPNSEPDPNSKEYAVYSALWDCESSEVYTESLNAAVNGLVKHFASYRKTHPTQVPIISGIDGIGGSTPVTIKIIWRPMIGNLRTIPTFFYMLCQYKKLDPEDPAQCGNWSEVLGDEFSGPGDYRFVAKWPDGQVRKGAFTINDGSNGKQWIVSP